MWPFDIVKKRKEQKRKKKIIILCSSIGTIVIGGGVATAIILSRLKPQPALEKSYDISESTILNYKVSAGTDIYYCNDFSRGETNNITLDHDLLDLKALSDDNECVTKFVITQDIDFGFLVNPNMDCKLSAINNAIVNCVSNSSSAYGIIVGRVELNDGIFKGKMEIDSSMTFNIIKTSVDYLGYGALGGVMFYSNSSESNIEINGTFKITGGNYGYGVQFRSNISGILTISGIFYVSATARACGFYCNGDAQKDSVQTINGVFTISSANEDASGAYYKSARSFSTQTINGVFTICGYALTILLRFEQSYVNSHQNITGVFTIYSPSSAACLLYCDEDSFHGLVNFNSVIVNFCESEKPIIGHLSCGNLNNWQVMMSAVKCFSQFIENYNIWNTLDPSWNGSYEWNGKFMTYNDNESSGDESLESGIIYDTLGGRYGYNFAIKIIVQAADDHKQIFNTAYKNYLSNYINNTDCPTAGKAWLSLIIPKIPLS